MNYRHSKYAISSVKYGNIEIPTRFRAMQTDLLQTTCIFRRQTVIFKQFQIIIKITRIQIIFRRQTVLIIFNESLIVIKMTRIRMMMIVAGGPSVQPLQGGGRCRASRCFSEQGGTFVQVDHHNEHDNDHGMTVCPAFIIILTVTVT